MNPARVLIVEDEAIVAMDLQSRLEGFGYVIVGTAASGEGAVALAAKTKPNLVMMDIRLKDAIDGIEAAKRIRQQLNVPVVFLTAHADEDTLHRAKLVGPFGYILKPFQDRELRITLEMALYKHEAESQIQHLNRLYAVLSQVNQSIIRATDIPSLFSEICSLSVTQGHLPLVWLVECNAGRPPLTLRGVAATDSAMEEALRACGGTALPASLLPDSGWEGRRSRVLKADDLEAHPGPLCELVRRFELRALALVTFRQNETVRGVLCFASREENFFGEKETDLVEEIALDLGYGMDNLQREQERQRILGVLQHRETMLRGITENMRDLVCLVDLEERFVYVTPSYQTMLGYAPVSLLGRSVYEHVHPQDVAAVRAAARVVIEQREPRSIEFLFQDAHGIYRWMESIGNVIAQPDGQITGLVVASRDITERKQAQEAVRLSEERYRNLVETSYDMIWEVDAEGRFTYVSPRARDILGYAPEEIIGKSPFEFMPPNEAGRVGAIFAAAARQQQPIVSLENTNRHQDGRLIVLETNGSPVFGPSGEFLGYRGMDRDITERKRLETQLLQSQKMEAVGQLAAGVAHDFNNILAGLMLHFGLLRGNPALDPAISEALADLEIQATRGANLTRQLLLFGRRSVMEIRSLNLNEVISQLLKMLDRLLGENIRIEFQPAPSLPLIEGDCGMLEQVVMNLSVNARDAMPKGGLLAIRTETIDLEADRPTIATPETGFPGGCYARLTVTDTGCGMDENVLKHIFEPFFTTKEQGKGTGLGLATVYGIVKQHQGWLEVESQPGKGSTFRISLPAKRDSSSSGTAALEPVPGGNETILLVEDDESVRFTVAQCLRMFGYDVIQTANAEEALTAWRRRSGEIALLFTDMVMPGGTTGLDLAIRFRKEKPGLKIILCSGYSVELEKQEHQRIPEAVYLPKPFVSPVLGAVVRACLDGRPIPRS